VIDLNADAKQVCTEAFDGRRGWQWKGKGTETIEESPKADRSRKNRWRE
jgi:hypothetical protein